MKINVDSKKTSIPRKTKSFSKWLPCGYVPFDFNLKPDKQTYMCLFPPLYFILSEDPEIIWQLATRLNRRDIIVSHTTCEYNDLETLRVK